jgi:hypothetical protein
MKNLHKYIIIISSALLIFGFLFSCHQRILPEEDYSEHRRVIGPEGGTINFYEYKPDRGEEAKVLVKMEFPAGALDSLVVFNMYEYHNVSTYLELYYMGIQEQSNYLYFVPYPESLGYSTIDLSETSTDTTYYKEHFSIEFNQPVTVTYYVNDYGIEDSIRLYRVNIPAENEWGTEDFENVWIKLNQQFYPNGYDDLDLLYLITGKWSQGIPYGRGTESLINWEELTLKDSTAYSVNTLERKVTFKIYDTDNMYLLGYRTPYYTGM